MASVGRLLARSQLGLSVLLITGYLGLWVMAGLKLITPDAPHELTPLIGIVIYFWFQRQRAHSDDDPPEPTPVPIQPASPATT